MAQIVQALRSLRRRPSFALAAILTIALGVGANVAVFRTIYAVLIRPLPFREPANLVLLWESVPALPQLQVTIPDFEDWRKAAHSFDDIAAYSFQVINKITLVGRGEPEILNATMATHNLFPMLGVQPLMGRNISADDESAQRQVGLISEKLWRRKFNADPSIVGQSLRFETLSFTVIGVVPERQAFPEWADVWMPFSFLDPELSHTRKYHPLEVIGRLKPGVTVEQAQAEIQSIAKNLSKAYPATNRTVGAYAISLAGEITGDVRPSLLIVWAAVGLVMLIACANLAHLVLARMVERRQETAIRVSLGASRAHLIGHFFTESLVLAALGGALGLLFAAGANGVFHGPEAAAQVWIFAVAISLACGVIFALPACWQAFLAEASLKGGEVNTRSVARGRSPLGSALIGAEIALAFLVLTGAILLTRSLIGLLNEDPGFQAKHVLVVDFPLPTSRYGFTKAEPFVRTRILPALRALPGVVDAAAANSAPLSLGRTEHSRYATRFGIEGRTFDAGRYPVAQIRWVSPEYFRVLGIPLRRGRWLTQEDLNQPRYAINETLARRFFPNEDPTSKRIVLGVLDPQPEMNQIVGVVGDVREMGLDEEAPPTLYFIGTSSPALLVRTEGDPMAAAPAIRKVVQAADPETAVRSVKPLEDYLADSLARRRFAVLLLASFAGLAAFLTAAGIYGVLAYSVSRRLREFGIRAAIGAKPGDLLQMILREAGTVAIPGLLAGLALALGFARLMKSLVYRISPMDPASLTGAAVFLAAICLLSAWLPARRAAKVDPSIALRQE
jgi:predicted permease